MSFETQPTELVQMWAQVGAMVTTRCEWCGRELRPCNLGRHIGAAHFRQLTFDEVVELYDELTQKPKKGGKPQC